MNDESNILEAEHRQALLSFLENPAEAELQRAYEIGRAGIAKGAGILAIVKLHQQAVAELVDSNTDPDAIVRRLQAAEAFLIETLSPFEAAHRGFKEAYEKALLLNESLKQRNSDLDSANRELNSRKQQLAEAERLARLGSWEWDVRNDKVTWSDELYRIFGCTPNEFDATVDAYLDFVHPDDRGRVEAIIAETVRAHRAFSFEERIIRKDGKIRVLRSKGEAGLDSSGDTRYIIGFCQDITEYRQIQNELHQLSARILTTQEEERAWISRELHDEIGQSLTAVSFSLAEIEKEAGSASDRISKQVTAAQDLLDETIETVHRFARELRPAMLDKLGLIPALRSHVKRFSERTGIQTRFRFSPAIEKLGQEPKLVVYRIIQESLNNIAKHAHATRVEIDIRRLKNRFFLKIRDNGGGFSMVPHQEANREKRLGIVGMQERVRLVNGVFGMESEPGSGTTVRVEIPLDKPAGREPSSIG